MRSACLIALLLLTACDANDRALSLARAADAFAGQRDRQTRTYPRAEAEVLAAARAVAAEDGAAIAVDAPEIGVAGTVLRHEVSDERVAAQMAVGVVTAILIGPAGAPQPVVRWDRRYTIVTRPSPAGTSVRVSIDRRDQTMAGAETVTAVGSEDAYRGFFERLEARLGTPPRGA